MVNVEELDHETAMMVKRLAVLRIATKHIQMLTRQLEMKMKDMSELAGLMKLGDVKKDIEKENDLERLAKRCTHHSSKRVKIMLFDEIDNMVWSWSESEITRWCKNNKVFDDITEDEIEEIWTRDAPEDEKPIRLNGKYV